MHLWIFLNLFLSTNILIINLIVKGKAAGSPEIEVQERTGGEFMEKGEQSQSEDDPLEDHLNDPALNAFVKKLFKIWAGEDTRETKWIGFNGIVKVSSDFTLFLDKSKYESNFRYE